ncbi:MAG TPA: SulP family inorganic anion transporter, partial [Nitrosospira sp.]
MLLAKLEYWVPLLHTVRTYRIDWLRPDFVAGMSVAAIQIPTAIAYAQLAGFGPEVGLYASMLPLVAYALFGSSRQLIVGPDAATCAIVAAVLVPLAAGDPGKYALFSAILGLLVGGLCILGGITRLGFLADFLSRPVLTGLMNGIALSIIVGQLGKVLGFSAEAHRFSLIILEFASRLRETHLPTLALGGGILALILLLGKKAPRVPGPLAGIVLGALAVNLLNLGAYDLKLVGSVPAGLPSLSLPAAGLDEIEALLSAALGIAVVSFCSAVLTARIFAVKNHYVIDANRDLVALGAANVMTGLSHGFVISGADSRTAVNDLVGGKTQITSLVAAACTALVLLFLTAPLAFVPVAALGAVLLTAGFKLLDFQSLRKVYFLSRFEFWHSILTTVAVIALGIV